MVRDKLEDDVGYRVVLMLGIRILLVMSVLCGCARKVYVPVEKTVMRTDTLRENLQRVDSVILRDSVSVMQRGDTVYYTRWRERVRVCELTDTVYKATTDSVRCPVPYPVERKLTKWERVKMSIGGWALVSLMIMAALAVIWLIKMRGG